MRRKTKFCQHSEIRVVSGDISYYKLAVFSDIFFVYPATGCIRAKNVLSSFDLYLLHLLSRIARAINNAVGIIHHKLLKIALSISFSFLFADDS